MGHAMGIAHTSCVRSTKRRTSGHGILYMQIIQLNTVPRRHGRRRVGRRRGRQREAAERPLSVLQPAEGGNGDVPLHILPGKFYHILPLVNQMKI